MTQFQYAVRPAKYILRRMIVDACRRMGGPAPLRDYEYVGFGGFEFVDFDLVHRELGIRRMVSIEYDSSAADRYLFNRPFSEIDVRFDRASAVLPDLLDDVRPRIVWLDYESRLNHEVLQDVATCLRRLRTGSALVVTVNAHPPTPRTERRMSLVEEVGEERIPPGIDDAALAKWGLANVQYRILTAEVPIWLGRRMETAEFLQLFHFRYQDGARMLAWGGVLVTADEAEQWRAAFAGLEQTRSTEEALAIEVPALTAKEAIHLNEQLPAQAAQLDAGGIPDADWRAYAQLYRWYPPVPTPI
jgi:hypothetical protein